MTTAEQNGVSVLDNLDPEAPRYLEGLGRSAWIRTRRPCGTQ